MATKSLNEMNQATFDAEERKPVGGKAWHAFLKRVLADGFRIRRANPAVPLQDKPGMIAWIKTHPPVPRTVSDVVTFEDGDFGVVTCIVTLDGQPDRFHNLKVFLRDRASGDWRCSYWHVYKA
jgi:hypothetical protein